MDTQDAGIISSAVDKISARAAVQAQSQSNFLLTGDVLILRVWNWIAIWGCVDFDGGELPHDFLVTGAHQRSQNIHEIAQRYVRAGNFYFGLLLILRDSFMATLLAARASLPISSRNRAATSSFL